MQFTADPNHQNLTPDHVDGTVYSLTLTLNEGIIDGAYGRAFVTVTGDGGVNYVTADDESFFVDIDTPMADEMALEPGSDTGASSSDEITNADSLVFRVDFSEPVVGLGPDAFHGVHGRRDRPGRGRGRRRCVLSGDRGRSGGRAF